MFQICKAAAITPILQDKTATGTQTHPIWRMPMHDFRHVLGILVHILQKIGHISTTMACYDALINIFFEFFLLTRRNHLKTEDFRNIFGQNRRKTFCSRRQKKWLETRILLPKPEELTGLILAQKLKEEFNFPVLGHFWPSLGHKSQTGP